MGARLTCSACGVAILAATSTRTGGRCVPCQRGTRAASDAARQDAAAAGSDLFWKSWTRIVASVRSSGFTALEPAERTFYAMNLLRGAVRRGGFLGYFHLYGVAELETGVRGFRDHGGAEIADVVDRAERVLFPRGVPLDPEERSQQLPCWTEEEIENGTEPPWSEAHEQLNHELYALQDLVDRVVERYYEDHLAGVTARQPD